MTIDDAIKRYTSDAFYEKSDGNLQGYLEFNQLAEWLKELKQLREQTRWIPVSERLPKKLEYVIIAFYDCQDEYDIAYLRTTFNETYKKNGAKNEWVSSMGETSYADYEVDAWMPIMPYKVESEGTE